MAPTFKWRSGSSIRSNLSNIFEIFLQQVQNGPKRHNLGLLGGFHRRGGENQTLRSGLKNSLVGEGRERFPEDVMSEIKFHQIEAGRKAIPLMVIL